MELRNQSLRRSRHLQEDFEMVSMREYFLIFFFPDIANKYLRVTKY